MDKKDRERLDTKLKLTFNIIGDSILIDNQCSRLVELTNGYAEIDFKLSASKSVVSISADRYNTEFRDIY